MIEVSRGERMTATSAQLKPAALQRAPQNMGLVVAASAAGTAFEWYDFFLFVPLAGIISKVFFGGLNDAAAYIFALLSFAAGFATRPLGALIFGRVGDRLGRKGTFLITITLMGVATFAVGLMPSYAQVGVVSPILFIGLRMLQGVALGGEWGGAAIYIAEHAPADRRGYLTSWIGTSAAFGLGGALVVVLATRTAVGEASFATWAWRAPFMLSAVLLAISIWIRMRLHESPVFERLRIEGDRSKAPYAEAFGRWSNLKQVLIALFSMMVAQGAIWYCAFFYAQSFIEKIVKVRPETVNAIMIAVVVCSAPLYVFFGWLSDKVGRKIVMVCGMILTTAAIYPGFHLIVAFGNPALAEAATRAPVTVTADPSTCSLQFDPVGKTQFKTSCDIAKSVLTNAGVSYRNIAAPKGALASVKVGETVIASADGVRADPNVLKALKAGVDAKIKAALKAAGYPTKADPARTNAVGVFLVILLFTVGATALYGPQAAAMSELFPARIRYTALSLPYHIGTGWVGGFLPATAFAMVAATGDIYFGLWYPIVAATLAILVTLFLLPETRGRDLDL
jgi:MFS family permease